MEYEATIGLEIHAELKTRTKMFCDSKNDSGEERPNVNVCPVCLAHPGTLPVINREAVRQVLRVGAAIGGTLADYTEFDRKNYFYPDLPKGYQISQYEYPLVSGGELSGVKIRRIHLEEDTASSVHDEESGETAIDYNRAGVPLMELVTEPVIQSAEKAISFARELQILLRYLGASDANMEKGEMRVEANVSVAPKGEISSTYVEIKNLNSFRTVERAIRYEIERQTGLLVRGEALRKETLGWDESAQKTFPQRTKEGSADYRYFPDPDLPSLKISEVQDFESSELRRSLPELPLLRRKRYLALGLKQEDADMFTVEPRFGDFFDAVSKSLESGSILVASNYIANDLAKIVRDYDTRDSMYRDEILVSAKEFGEVMRMLGEGVLSSRGAKDLIAAISAPGFSSTARAVAEEKGILQKSDAGELAPIVEEVLRANGPVVADYLSGKEAALQFLIGQCMRLSKGSGNPAQFKILLADSLKKK